MNLYTQTTQQLFDLQKYAIKLGLYNIGTLTLKYGNPHLKYPTIHIAGTNGKGSTAFYIAKMLQSCGLKVGLFTSPHLVDFRERIRVNDQLIEKKYVIDFWRQVKDLVHSLKATFFDTTTLLAFKYFADKKIDVAVIETGLGGRLDSTNILEPDVCVITSISFDHQKHLGSTLEQIATEKAGIIKPGCQVFSAEQVEPALNVLKSKVDNLKKFHYLPDLYATYIKKQNVDGMEFELLDKEAKETLKLYSSSPAQYQPENIALAYVVFKNYTFKKGLKSSIENIKQTIKEACWPGRMQLIQKNPYVFFDVSHNLDGIKSTIHSFEKIINLKKTTLLLGIVNDKDAESIVKFLAGKFYLVVVTEPETLRKQDGEFLLRLFKATRQKVKLVKDLQSAYEIILKGLKNSEILIALGSHYLVGSIMNKLK